MSEARRSRSVARYLPYVILATLSVAISPLLVVYVLEGSGTITSPWLATAVAVVLSVALSRAGSWLWMRHSGSKDLVFGDLMLWGWIRRLRTDKKLNNAIKTLGFGREGRAFRDVEMSADRRREVLRELANALEAGDPFTHGHTKRVTRYSYMLAKTMRLSEETVRKIHVAASVHDVGKIDTPPEILNKPGALTDEEFEIMKRHSATGAEMVKRLGDPEVTAMVRHHHERIDGRGYPDGIAGDKIPMGARVIAVADTFDAIISTRPYRSARKHKAAIEIIKKVRGSQLDPAAVDAFLAYYNGRKPLAWWLSISAVLQRVLGGFGGWLQHAGGASLAQGTASVSAAIVFATAVAGVGPAATPPDAPPDHVVVLETGATESSDDDGPGSGDGKSGAWDDDDNGSRNGSGHDGGKGDGKNGPKVGTVDNDGSRDTGSDPAEDDDPVVTTPPDDGYTPVPMPEPQPQGKGRGKEKNENRRKGHEKGKNCGPKAGDDEDGLDESPVDEHNKDPEDGDGKGKDKGNKDGDNEGSNNACSEEGKGKGKDNEKGKGGKDKDEDGTPGSGNGDGKGGGSDKGKGKGGGKDGGESLPVATDAPVSSDVPADEPSEPTEPEVPASVEPEPPVEVEPPEVVEVPADPVIAPEPPPVVEPEPAPALEPADEG